MSENKPPLWKQLLGAATGAGIALALYGVYTWAEPYLQGSKAWLTIPQADIYSESTELSRVSDDSTDSRRVESIASRAREIAERFSLRRNEPEQEDYDIHVDPIRGESLDAVVGGLEVNTRDFEEELLPEPEVAAVESDTEPNERELARQQARAAAAERTSAPLPGSVADAWEQRERELQQWEPNWQAVTSDQPMAAEPPAPVHNQLPPPPPPQVAQNTITHSPATNLPNSGLGMWLAASLALAAAGYVQRKRLTLMCADLLAVR